jgi:DNA replication protein DnaC
MKVTEIGKILRTLKLDGMAKALEDQTKKPDFEQFSFEKRLAMLLESEITQRDNRRLIRLLRIAKLRDASSLEDIDYTQQRGMKKNLISSLSTCDWIRASQNLCVTGPTGTGKTFLACALGLQACRAGISVRYLRLPRLFETMRIARGDGSFIRYLNLLAKTDLLILDDWGLQKPGGEERNNLLELLEDRYAKRSTLVTSQIPVKNWHDFLGEPTLADAILDRLIHNAHKIELAGESMRKKKKVVDRD